MRKGWFLPAASVALALVTACQGPTSTKRTATVRPGRAITPASTTNTPPALNPRILTGERPLLLGGEVRLISDHGGAIISNNSGALISDQGGGIVSNNSGAIVSNNSGAVISNNAGNLRVLAQAEATATPGVESRLADAVVELLDAAGRPLAGPDGKPITATTDRQGRYRLEAHLPPGEGAVARVKLYNGGELRALVLGEAGATQSARNLDTAATLGASYVLDELVKGKAELLAKVPLAEVVALDREAEAARARLGADKPKYTAEETLALARRLKGEDKAFGDRLDRIAALLAAGQENRGSGLPATRVPLSAPVGAMRQADGALVVFELFYGQPRKIRTDGILEELNYPSGGLRPLQLRGAWPARNGGMWLLEGHTGRIFKVDPDLKTTVEGPGFPEANAASPIWVEAGAVAEGPAGELVVGTDDIKRYPQGTVLIRHPDGRPLEEILLPPQIDGLGTMRNNGIGAVALSQKGELYVAAVGVGRPLGSNTDKAYWWMAKRLPDLSWQALYGPVEVPSNRSAFIQGSILPDRAEGPLAVLDGPRALLAPGPDGRWQPINTTQGRGITDSGSPIAQARFSQPMGLTDLGGGRVAIVDMGSGLVQVLGPDGRVVDLAGSRSLEAVGQAQVVGINTPGQPLELPDGSLLLPEGSSGLIKRLLGGKLDLFAGSGGESGPFPGQATEVGLALPQALARDPKSGDIYVVTGDGLLKVNPQGLVTSLLGGAKIPEGAATADPHDQPAAQARVGKLTGVCVDPEGRPWFTSRSLNAVFMLDHTGLVKRMAGRSPAQSATPNPFDPDGAATDTVLMAPFGLATGPDGLIYVADTLRFRVRAIDPKTGLQKAVAGCTLIEAASKSNEVLDPDGGPALDARLLGPIALAFDAEGSLYIAEAGTGVAARGAGLVPNLGFEVPDIAPQIRKRTRDGRLFRIVGQQARVLTAQSGEDSLGMPTGILVDAQGRLVISDSVRNQVKIIPAEGLKTP